MHPRGLTFLLRRQCSLQQEKFNEKLNEISYKNNFIPLPPYASPLHKPTQVSHKQTVGIVPICHNV